VTVRRPMGRWKVGFGEGRCADPAGQPTIEELQAFVTTLVAATPDEWVQAGS